MAKSSVLLSLVALFLPAVSAAEFTLPDCDALRDWAASADAGDPQRFAPRLEISPALAEEQLVPVFGLGASDWSGENVMAARKVAHQCYQQARRGGDKEGARTFRAGRDLIARELRRINQRVGRARATVAKQRAAMEALPDSPELAEGIRLLVRAPSYADTDHRALNRLPREVGRPLASLYQDLRWYPDSEREVLYAELAERAAQIQADMLDAAAAAIAAAAEDAAGLLEVRRTRLEVEQRLGDSPGPRARRVLDAGSERATAIQKALAQQDGAWRPPGCKELYRWGGASGAADFRGQGRHAHKAAFGDDRLEPLFGLPLTDWDDRHLVLYSELAEVCEARWRALLPAGQSVRRIGPDAPELVRLAADGAWVTHQATVTRELPEARDALREYAVLQERLAQLRAELATLPRDQDGLDRLEAMAREPALRELGHTQRRAFQEELHRARARVGAGMGQSIIADLGEIEVAEPAHLRTLWRYREQAGLQRLDPSTRALVEARFDQVLRKGLADARPAYDAALAALPISDSGAEEALAAASALTGLPESTPALAAYREAGRKRAVSIRSELEQRRCLAVQERVDIDGDAAAQALWTGREGSTLGDFVCALERAGHTVNTYEGPGLFSNTHTLQLTDRDQTLQTLYLHAAEVSAGEEMLVGYKFKDANRSRELSMADWRSHVDALNGSGASVECARLMNTPANQLSVDDRMKIIGCVMQQGVEQIRAQERERSLR